MYLSCKPQFGQGFLLDDPDCVTALALGEMAIGAFCIRASVAQLTDISALPMVYPSLYVFAREEPGLKRGLALPTPTCVSAELHHLSLELARLAPDLMLNIAFGLYQRCGAMYLVPCLGGARALLEALDSRRPPLTWNDGSLVISSELPLAPHSRYPVALTDGMDVGRDARGTPLEHPSAGHPELPLLPRRPTLPPERIAEGGAATDSGGGVRRGGRGGRGVRRTNVPLPLSLPCLSPQSSTCSVVKFVFIDPRSGHVFTYMREDTLQDLGGYYRLKRNGLRVSKKIFLMV